MAILIKQIVGEVEKLQRWIGASLSSPPDGGFDDDIVFPLSQSDGSKRVAFHHHRDQVFSGFLPVRFDE